MYGIEAINANNGWAISLVGTTIVFSGLISLSIVISQLHKVLGIYEHPQRIRQLLSFRAPKGKKEPPLLITQEQRELFKQYALLKEIMDDNISLPRLLNFAQVSGIKHPHSILYLLLKSGILFTDHQGWFHWNQDLFDRTVPL